MSQPNDMKDRVSDAVERQRSKGEDWHRNSRAASQDAVKAYLEGWKGDSSARQVK